MNVQDSKPVNTETPEQSSTGMTRRDLLKAGVAVSAAGLFANLGTNYAHAQGADRIRVGVIGVGGRGSGAAEDCANAHPSVQIVAIGDLFQDRIGGVRNGLGKKLGEQWKVTDETTFSGFDNYKKVIDSGIDLLVTATPPGFRPMIFDYAVKAGKHVFMEKPVAVDPTGVRSIIASSDLATQKNLSVVVGTQRRHQDNYRETIKRIHDGAIGDVISGQVYWNQGGLWNRARQAGWSDMEWQIRNWLYFTWLSGDHITEQHVHNLDVMNWVMNAHPVAALGMGGRQVRTDPSYGHIYDHFTIEYEFANGAKWLSMCRQQDGTASRVSESAQGTKGRANPGGSISGENQWRQQGGKNNGYKEEHVHLIASIRDGKPINEGRQIAESTLTAIMGRESAYTGQHLKWDDVMNSKQDLMPKTWEFGELATPPVAVPGKTKLERTSWPAPEADKA